MKKITITPIEGALDDVPKEHLQKWFEALQVSVKHEGGMCNDDDTAHCCLCVSARLEGMTRDEYMGALEVYDAEFKKGGQPAPITFGFQNAHVATVNGKSQDLRLDRLNDGFFIDSHHFRLTHPQIAEIIMGREVVLEIES